MAKKGIFDDLIKRAELELKQEIKELEKNSKDITELIRTERFIVDEVLSESYSTNIKPMSEMRLGGSSPSYSGGYSTKLMLSVTPVNDIPVRTLQFNGNAPIYAGDTIEALIPRYEERKPKVNFQTKHYHTKTYYLDRDYAVKESAIEIRILQDNKVVRTDRSADHFTGKSEDYTFD